MLHLVLVSIPIKAVEGFCDSDGNAMLLKKTVNEKKRGEKRRQ